MDIIKAEMRDPTAKAKQLRKTGIVPCVISGTALKESLPVQIDRNTARLLRRTKRNGSKVDIQVDGRLYHTLIKDLDYSSLNDTVVHIGFQVLDADKKVNSVADIIILNKDKVQGVFEQMQMKIPHAALPEHLLDTVTVDLAEIPVGTTVTVGDIPEFRSENIELQVEPESIVFRIRDKKRADPGYTRSEEAAE